MKNLSGILRRLPAWGWFFEFAAAAGVIAAAAWFVMGWKGLPAGGPGRSVLLAWGAAVALAYAWYSFVEFHPGLYAYPRPLPEREARRRLRLERTLVGALKAELTWGVAYMEHVAAEAAAGRSAAPPEWANAAGAAVIALTVALWWAVARPAEGHGEGREVTGASR
ncbi:MAG: hypothetical protein QJR08_06230 [Bacillota bacterium]|nr:hypothetical protein [Bacillota bacterium]